MIFNEKLTERSGIKFIDFANYSNNSLHVVTTLLINGMPLIFIEAKKPNNRDGILAERQRLVSRFQNPKFRRFVNITQFMVFSNNMEYDDNPPQTVEGAFYASPSYDAPLFNYFREEEDDPDVVKEAKDRIITAFNNKEAEDDLFKQSRDLEKEIKKQLAGLRYE